MYLVDTNVLSVSTPGRRSPNLAVDDWVRRHSGQLYLSAVSVAEFESGVAKARRQDGPVRTARLREWLERVVSLFSTRILRLDLEVARILGSLLDGCRASGTNPGLADLIIAATARAHDLTLLSRNLRHFESLPVRVLDPFQSLPPGEP